MARSDSVLICWAASRLEELRSISTLTAWPLAEIFLTMPKETTSREKPGYFTVCNACLTDSSVIIFLKFSGARSGDFGFDQPSLKVGPEGRHFAESRNCFGQGFNEIIEFGISIILAEAEENISLGERFGQANGSEDRRNAHRFGDASRTGRNRDAFDIEHERKAFAFDEFDGDIEVRGMAMFGIFDWVRAIEGEVGDPVLEGAERLDLK